jgi:hypothetical protein
MASSWQELPGASYVGWLSLTFINVLLRFNDKRLHDHLRPGNGPHKRAVKVVLLLGTSKQSPSPASEPCAS